MKAGKTARFCYAEILILSWQNMRFYLLLLYFGFTLLVQPCFAAGWTPELDSPKNDEESESDIWYSQYADIYRRSAVQNRLLEEARSLYAQGKYREAVDRVKLSKKLERNGSNEEIIALCLAHIGRPVEALAALSKLPKSDWSTRVSVYETLGMHKEAINACVLPDANIEPYALKCALLMKYGERTKAIELASSP